MKFLDTPVFRPIRFRQKVLTVFPLELFSLERKGCPCCRAAFSFVEKELCRSFARIFLQGMDQRGESMFCNGCGAPLNPGQRFCSRCGKESLGPIESRQIQRGRVREHIRLLGILWMAYSAFSVIGGLAMIVVSNTVFAGGHFFQEQGGPPSWVSGFMHPLLMSLGLFVLAKSGAGFVAGWGLMQKAPWARILSLILAFFALFNIPMGTALGIYTLWVFLPAESEKHYEEQVRVAQAG